MNGVPAAHNPTQKGYHAVYRENEVNHCPGCGRTHWHIGRVSAECAFCGTVMDLDMSAVRTCSKPVIVRRGNGGGKSS